MAMSDLKSISDFGCRIADIGYKISRGTAALLGKTKGDALVIYARMKKLYGKRSALVHAGDAKITQEDIYEMRGYTDSACVSCFRLIPPRTF
jgi:hypothetical protein